MLFATTVIDLQQPIADHLVRAGLVDLDISLALQAGLPLESTMAYLKTFGDGDGLDFVHRCCLARAWATITHKIGRAHV